MGWMIDVTYWTKNKFFIFLIKKSNLDNNIDLIIKDRMQRRLKK